MEAIVLWGPLQFGKLSTIGDKRSTQIASRERRLILYFGLERFTRQSLRLLHTLINCSIEFKDSVGRASVCIAHLLSMSANLCS